MSMHFDINSIELLKFTTGEEDAAEAALESIRNLTAKSVGRALAHHYTIGRYMDRISVSRERSVVVICGAPSIAEEKIATDHPIADDQKLTETVNSAARCFHLLLKIAIDPDYSIPTKCDQMSLDDLKIDFTKHQDGAKMAEMMVYSNGVLMDEAFIGSALASIPFEKWPGKGEVVVEFFLQFPVQGRKVICPLMKDSPCEKTKEVALCFEKAFRHHYPSICRLQELLPQMNGMQIWRLFNLTFPWNFDDGQLGSCGNLTISRQRAMVCAFDKNTRLPIWSILSEGRTLTYCQLLPFGLCLVYGGRKELLIYNPESGEKTMSVELPFFPTITYVSSDGYCYFGNRVGPFYNGHRDWRFEHLLYGGKISSGQWKELYKEFRVKVPINDNGDLVKAFV